MSVFQFRHVSMGLAVIVGITAGAVAGPAEKAQIKPRQDKLRDMGGALKAITDELKKPKVDWDNTIILNAQTMTAKPVPSDSVQPHLHREGHLQIFLQRPPQNGRRRHG